MRPTEGLQSRKLIPSEEFSIGRVEIADYIDQPGLVLETADGEVRAARNHLWAEPVYAGVRRHLTVNIARAYGRDILPNSLVKTPVVIDVHIDQLHGTNKGTARLVAHWWLRRDGEVESVHQFAEEIPLAEDGYHALVVAEKALLTRLASEIAASLETVDTQ
jgi:uncharacterized lipoprotein YmbA